MPCAPFRMTFSTRQCFPTYYLPSALQSQYFCIAVYPMSSSLLPLLHLHGYFFSSTLQFINIVPINLILKLPSGGRWSFLLWHVPCPPHIHKMWCLQVRTFDFEVSKEGLLKGQWGSHRAGSHLWIWKRSAPRRALSLQGGNQALTVHAAASPGPHKLCSGLDHSVLCPCHS